MSFNSGYHEGCTYIYYSGNDCGRSDGLYYSDFSFVDVMKREGLTDDDIFTACSYERVRTSANSHGWNGGKSYAEGTVQSDCVIEKFVAKLGQANWTLYSSPTNVDTTSSSLNTVLSWHFTRQNATSS